MRPPVITLKEFLNTKVGVAIVMFLLGGLLTFGTYILTSAQTIKESKQIAEDTRVQFEIYRRMDSVQRVKIEDSYIRALEVIQIQYDSTNAKLNSQQTMLEIMMEGMSWLTREMDRNSKLIDKNE